MKIFEVKSKTSWVSKAVLLCLVGMLFVGCQPSSIETQKPPNVVLILVDDMGYSDLGVMGSEIDTPNIDALAEEGTLFTHFFNGAKCEVTRSTMLTGLYYQQTQTEAGREKAGGQTVLAKDDTNVTLAEILGSAGYETILSGKWHLGHWRDQKGTPMDRGFDHFFGHLGGAINYFTGENWGTGKHDVWMGEDPYELPGDFYSTDAFTDYAIDRVTESARNEDPFFLYLAYNAPHFPLQVPQENIEEYLDRGIYKQGWDRIRQQRYERMKKLGIIDTGWALSKRDTLVPAWNTLTPDQQQEEELLMATYAGMVDRLDQQVGRVLQHLEELGIKDNTIVMFLSDNGASPFDANRTPKQDPGPADSERWYNVEWANVSNTPLYKYKQWMHEGGISTPMIIRWPNHIKPGVITDTPGHILDIFPTLMDMTGSSYPKKFNGNTILPLEGVSLSPVLNGDGDTNWTHPPIIFEFDGNRVVRNGHWKLVAQRGDTWELYNIRDNRTETHNVAEQNPIRVKKMANMYAEWAKRVGGMPNEEARKMPLNRRAHYTFHKD